MFNAFRSRAMILGALLNTLSSMLYANAMTFESEGMRIDVELVSQGLQIPWAMEQVDNKQLLLNERAGRSYLINRFSGEKKAVRGLPKVWAQGQGGLLDLKPAADFETSRRIYFTYSKPYGDTAVTTLAQAELHGDTLDNWKDLLVTVSETDTSRHFGSRIALSDQHIYFSVGDRGVRDNGQNLQTHAGSILRLNLDGSVPADNPFLKRSEVLPEIWSYGHRNPQGLAYDRRNKRLWAIEHGPRGGDELNLARAGLNYGWPVISYGKEYWAPLSVGDGTHREGMEQPVKYYVPSIAPGSLLLYTGAAFPQWQGNLFAGALALTHLNRIILSESGLATGEERLLEDLSERIRSLAQSVEGWLYVATDQGNLYVLKPTKKGP